MGNIRFMYINKGLLKDKDYKRKNNILETNLYPYLLFNSSVIYSSDYIVVTNAKGVYLETFGEFLNRVKSDSKFNSYVNLKDNTEAIIAMELSGKFTCDIIELVFGSSMQLNISRELETNDYVLNHYFKKSNRLKIKGIIEDKEKLQEMDRHGYILSLLESGLNLDLLTISLDNEDILWAYFNIQEDAGYYYPIIHIADYNIFSETRNLVYNKYFVPDYILSTLLEQSAPVVLNGTVRDFVPTRELCSKCKFSASSNIHKELCNLWYKDRLGEMMCAFVDCKSL